MTWFQENEDSNAHGRLVPTRHLKKKKKLLSFRKTCLHPESPMEKVPRGHLLGANGLSPVAVKK